MTRARWLLSVYLAVSAGLGLVFLAGIFNGSLSVEHRVGHLVLGPLLVTLAIVQTKRARNGRAARGLDVALGLAGAALAALPFVVPAPGLHVPGHAVAGGLVLFAAALRPLLVPNVSNAR